MSNRTVFTCAECGEVVPLKELSHASLKKAGTRRKVDALLSLLPDDVICQECDVEGYDTSLFGDHLGRTERERWGWSGLVLDRVQLDWLSLNY